MIYYVELDENKKHLEIKKIKNIESFRKEINASWVTVNEYLNGPSNLLNCGVKRPFVSRSKKLYIISNVDGYLEMKNYPYMSRDVIKDMKYIDSFRGGYEGVIDR